LFLQFLPRLLPLAIAGAGLQGGMNPEPTWLSQPGVQEGLVALKKQRGDAALWAGQRCVGKSINCL